MNKPDIRIAFVAMAAMASYMPPIPARDDGSATPPKARRKKRKGWQKKKGRKR